MSLRSPQLLAGAIALALLAAAAYWLSVRAAGPQWTVTGGDGGSLPRAQPEDEHLDAAALQRLSNDAAASGLRALVVLRHGHVVFERYAGGIDADTSVDSGAMAQALVALAAGSAVQTGALTLAQLNQFDPEALRAVLEAGTHEDYPHYLSEHLWRRINAADASIRASRGTAAAPAGCCLQARVLDWLRVAEILVSDGRFEGKDIVPAGWIARMRRPLAPREHAGFGVALPGSGQDNDLFLLRGPGHWRLWLLPEEQLAVLFGADAPVAAGDRADWDELRLPELVRAALTDGAQRREVSPLQQLVPNH